jgi:hypothetical protein
MNLAAVEGPIHIRITTGITMQVHTLDPESRDTFTSFKINVLLRFIVNPYDHRSVRLHSINAFLYPNGLVAEGDLPIHMVRIGLQPSAFGHS